MTANTLAINDTTITSDQNPRTASQVPGRPHRWEVSWLPGQVLDRNTAITAVVLADTTGSGDLHEGHRLWPHIQSWAAELRDGAGNRGRAMTPAEAFEAAELAQAEVRSRNQVGRVVYEAGRRGAEAEMAAQRSRVTAWFAARISVRSRPGAGDQLAVLISATRARAISRAARNPNPDVGLEAGA